MPFIGPSKLAKILLVLPFIGTFTVMGAYFKREIQLFERNNEEFLYFAGKIIIQRISFTILIPVFNKFIYLTRSLKSLKSQSYQNYEIIYIDDYSSDQSSEFILQEMRKDKRIKLVQHTYNQGICNAKIHAVLHSKGDYIMNLDPDDIFFSNTLNYSYHKAIETNSDILDILVKYKKGRYYIRNWFPCKKNYSDRELLLNDLQHFKFQNTPWNLVRKVVKNNIYKKSVIFLKPFLSNIKIIYSEDLIQTGIMFLFTRNWICTNFIGYVYYGHLPNSSMTGYYQSKKQNEIQKKLVKLLLKYFFRNRFNLDNCNLDDFLNNSYNRFVYNSVNNLSRINSKKKCDIDFNGLNSSYNEKDGYCFIE